MPTALIDRMDVRFGVPVPMRDGVALATDLHLPSSGGPWPCLLQRVPYDRGNPAILNGALDVARAVRRGYAVVTQDCRGRFASGGDFRPFHQEGADGEDAVLWICAQEWSDGSVAMFGRSYSGILQWWTAARAVPGLRAIAPALSGPSPIDDWFGGDGPLEWGFTVLWTLRHLAPDLLARSGWPVPAEELVEAIDDIESVLREDLGDRRLDRLRSVVPFLDDWLDETDGDARRALLDMAPDTADCPVPALVIAGWFDVFLRGCLRAAGASGRAAKALVVGPWAHGGSLAGVFPERSFGARASADALGLSDVQLDWFDRWLRREEPGADEPRVRWFHMGADAWRSATSFPPPGTAPLALHLAADGSGAGALAATAPAEHVAALPFDEDDPVPTVGGCTFLPGLEVAANAGPRDQASIAARKDVASFVSAVLDTPVDIVGAVTCTVVLDTELAGTSLVARLAQVTDDGRWTLVADGAARAGPGAAEAVRVELGPTSWRFPAGSRFGLLLSVTSWPRYRRWVTPGRPDAPRAGTVAIRCGGPVGSVLELSVEGP